jgi:hypothetical protein
MYKIGDYVCTLVNGFAMDGHIVGKHGTADYYAVRTLDGECVYRWGDEIKRSISDSDFVEIMNAKFA